MGPSAAATFGAPFELQTLGRTHLLVSLLLNHSLFDVCYLQAARNQEAVTQWVSVIKEKMLPEAK